MPWRTAQAAISARVDRPSLARMLETWTAAVFGRDEQPLGELAVRQPVGEQRGDLPLACGQLAVGPRSTRPAGAGPAPRRGPCARPASGRSRRRSPGGSPPAPRPGRRCPSSASASAVRSVPITGLARHGSGSASTRRQRRGGALVVALGRAPAAPRRGPGTRRSTGGRASQPSNTRARMSVGAMPSVSRSSTSTTTLLSVDAVS